MPTVLEKLDPRRHWAKERAKQCAKECQRVMDEAIIEAMKKGVNNANGS